ncbi:MAG: hypothetical protein GY828_03890 [Candidatus Gracilibacteria bacterium]|nr:hypothetical protein [Candidatus Gracilibacteria bacterium]
MKNFLTLVLLLMFLFINVHADFMSKEIDPICSISGKTHTSFPGEISDTSSWSIPKAYDGECIKVPVLKIAKKKILTTKVLQMFEDRNLLETHILEGYTLTSEGEKFAQDIFFPAVAKYIAREIKKSSPNKKAISILNYAVSIIGYDYFLNTEVKGDDYVGMSVENAKKLAINNNTTLRVVILDGEYLPVTEDYRPGRINAEVTDNIIIDYTVE